MAHEPSEPVLRWQLAWVQLSLRRNGPAIDSLRECLRLSPASPTYQTSLAWALAMHACDLKRPHRGPFTDEVHRLAASSRQGAPADGWSLGLLARAFRALGDLADAEEAALGARALSPDRAEHHAVLAEVMRDQGRPQEALGSATEARRLEPARTEWHLLVFDCLVDLGRLEDAGRTLAWVGRDGASPNWPAVFAREKALLAAREREAKGAALRAAFHVTGPWDARDPP